MRATVGAAGVPRLLGLVGLGPFLVLALPADVVLLVRLDQGQGAGVPVPSLHACVLGQGAHVPGEPPQPVALDPLAVVLRTQLLETRDHQEPLAVLPPVFVPPDVLAFLFCLLDTLASLGLAPAAACLVLPLSSVLVGLGRLGREGLGRVVVGVGVELLALVAPSPREAREIVQQGLAPELDPHEFAGGNHEVRGEALHGSAGVAASSALAGQDFATRLVGRLLRRGLRDGLVGGFTDGLRDDLLADRGGDRVGLEGLLLRRPLTLFLEREGLDHILGGAAVRDLLEEPCGPLRLDRLRDRGEALHAQARGPGARGLALGVRKLARHRLAGGDEIVAGLWGGDHGDGHLLATVGVDADTEEGAWVGNGL